MIATIHIPLEGDDGFTLTLNDEGRWVSSDWPDIAQALNSYLHEQEEASDREPINKVRNVAKRLGGEILYLKT